VFVNAIYEMPPNAKLLRPLFSNALASDRVVGLEQIIAQSAVILVAPDWLIAVSNYLGTHPRLAGCLI